jgi:hypothetical protein
LAAKVAAKKLKAEQDALDAANNPTANAVAVKKKVPAKAKASADDLLLAGLGSSSKPAKKK